MENSFDAIYRDPATVITPAYAPEMLFWRELQYIPPEIMISIENELGFSYMTSIQHSIFTTISSQNKIYNIISPPNTGTTISLIILSLLTAREYQECCSILWIFSNLVNLNSVKDLFIKLLPGIRIVSEPSNSLFDIALCSTSKNHKKKTEVLIASVKDKIKMVVIDCADEILQTKELREWIGTHILREIYQLQVGSYPTLYFTQLGNNVTHVATFIKELDTNLTQQFRIRALPIMIENSLNDTLKLIPQYFITILGASRWLYKILGNTSVRINRGILICGNVNYSDLSDFQYSEIGINSQEPEIFQAIDKVKKGIKRILICKDNLPKRIKTCGFGAVIHMGLPLNGVLFDIQEYRTRVERVYSPQFVGVSVIVCREIDVENIKKLGGNLNVNIERLPGCV